MNEESTKGTPTEETLAGGKAETTQIMDELGKLANKVASAVQTALESEEFKRAEMEIRKVLSTAGDRIDEVAQDLRKSDVTQDLQHQASRAADAVQQSEVTKQVKSSMLRGLRRINEELGEFLDRGSAEQSAAEAGESAAQAAEEAAQKAADTMAKAADAAKDNLA